MVKLAVLASFGLALVGRALGASEISVELENHYNGYPHVTPNTAAGATSQNAPNSPQVNSFIPLVFSYTGRLPNQAVTPIFGRNVTALVTVEKNGDPGDIPTYLFNGQKPAVANNYPSIFPAKKGRKLLQQRGVVAGTYTGCLSATPPTAFANRIGTANTSASWEDYKVALCTNLLNSTNPNEARVNRGQGRHLLQALRTPVLKLYGEVKKSASTGFPMLTYVFDFTTRPTLTLLTKTQPVGAVPPNGTMTFVDCTLYLPDGAFVRSAPKTCFDTTPVEKGVPQPVIVRLAAKSFYYGSGFLTTTAAIPAPANRGTQVTPVAAFSVNFRDTQGLPNKSIVYQANNGFSATIVQAYGVYVDPSGIYPGQNK